MAGIEGVENAQERALVGWFNNAIKKRDKRITKFPNDLEDGLFLAAAYEELTKKTVKIDRKPKLEVQKMANVSMELKAFEDDGVPVTCGAAEVVQGNKKMVLGLIWALIRRYQLSESSKSNTEEKVVSIPTVIVESLSHIEIPVPFDPKEKLAPQVKDGIVFCVLVKTRAPQSEIVIEKLRKDQPKENVSLALHCAEKYLDIPPLLEPEDVVEGALDEQTLTTYVSYFGKIPEKKPEEVPQQIIEEKPVEVPAPVEVVQEAPQHNAELEKLQLELENLKLKLKQVEHEKSQSEQENGKLKSQLTASEKSLTEMEKKWKQTDQQKIQLEQEISKLKKENEDLKGKLTQANNEVKSGQDQISKLKSEFQVEKNNYEKLLQENSQQMDTLQKMLLEYEEASDEDARKLQEAMKAAEDEANNKMRDTQIQLENAKKEMQQLEQQNETLQKELDNVKETYQRDVARLEEISKLKRKMEKEVEFLNDRLKEETEESEKLREQVKKIQMDMDDITVEEKRVTERKTGHEQKSADLEVRLRRVEREKEQMAKEARKQQDMLDKIKRQKEEEVKRLKEKLVENSKIQQDKKPKLNPKEVRAQMDVLEKKNAELTNQLKVVTTDKETLKQDHEKEIKRLRSRRNHYKKLYKKASGQTTED